MFRELLRVCEHQTVYSVFDEFMKTIISNIIYSKYSADGEDLAYQAKSKAQTGNPHPNISTTFIGKSNCDELEWSEIPRSADPNSIG